MSNPACIQGSVQMASPTTNDSPFTVDDHGVMHKDGVYILRWKDDVVVSCRDGFYIARALNAAYQRGYYNGFTAPRFIQK